MFADLGAKVLDADRVVHRLMAPNGRCYRRIIRQFGCGILRGKAIDRQKLAGIVFTAPAKRKKLEGIIHPCVRSEFKRLVAAYARGGRVKAVILEIPLLFESGHYRWLSTTVVVKASQGAQIERLRHKTKQSQADILRRIKAQMPIAQKIRKADYVIDNRGDRRNTKKQVVKIWNDLISENKKK